MATGGRYPSTKERVNYGRICRIVVDLCTDVMRKILTKLVVPSQLLAEVRKCSDLRKLAADELHRISNAVAGTSYGKFDISLLYKLIRAIGTQGLRYDLDKSIPANSICTKMQSVPSLMAQLTSKQYRVVQTATDYSDFDCGLLTHIIIKLNLTSVNIPTIIPSANDWGGKSPPKPTDVKLGDDIERIRFIRNTIYGHVGDTCVTDSEFQKYLTELTGVMQRMDQEFNTGGQYLKDLNDIETASLDDKWEMYESTIQKLAEREQEIKDRLEKQEEYTQQLQQDVDALNKEVTIRLEKQEESAQQLQIGVDELNQKNKEVIIRLEKHEESSVQLQKDVTVLHTSETQMKSRIEKQEESTGELQTGVKQMDNRLEKQEASTWQLQKGVSSLNKSISEMGGKVDVMQTQVTSLSFAQDERQRTDNKTVLALKENIVKAKKCSEVAKQLLNEIKKASCATEAEKKEPELCEKVDEWKTVIRKAVSLQEKLQRTCAKDDVLPSDLDLEYLHSAEERGHKHNIRGLIYEASTEIKLKREEISLGKLKSWTNNQKSFYPTKATEHIYKEVKSKRNCLTTGLPGSGKTANLQHIALRLKNEGHRLCCVQTFKELLSKVDKFGEEEKQVYFVDDVFGVHGVSEDKTKEWTGAEKDDLERCLNNTNISILCSSRKQVTDDLKLSNIKSRFTIINISEGELELSSEEHVGILEKHAITEQRKNLLTENKDQLKTEIKEKVREIKCPVGCFPLVCHLYTGEEDPKQAIEEYFSKPLNVIADHFEKLKVEDHLSHFCLLLCLIYDNKLPVNIITVGDESKETKKLRKELLELCKLPVATPREDIREKMDTLLQTFVKLEGDMYQFVHDIIHDAVIKHVSGLSSSVHKVIMRHCSSKFMSDRVHLSGVVCKNWQGRGHDTDSCINIRPDSFICWGDCVLDIVRDGVRTSDQLYNDIDEGRCSRYDGRALWDNPWWDVFYNRCVHSTEGQTAIVQALKSSDVQTIMCTKGYCLPGYPRVTGLHWAMRKGLTHIVTQTMSMLSPTQLREVVSIQDRGLLSWAIRGRCDTDVIQALIVGGADVNTPDIRGRTPLYLAICGGCGTDVIQALIVGGADVNTPDVHGDTPLCRAINEGCGTDVIQALIVGGADVNTPDVRGFTPLYLAICGGCGTDVIQALIDGGADVNTPDVRGSTPLCSAIDRRCGTDVIQALIDGGADVNTPVRSFTPLYLAICGGCGTDVIQALIIGGADVNTPDVFGDTPLHLSVRRGDYKITQLLVDNRADINQCDEYGTSVLYKSQLYGRDTITELLQSRDAVCIYKGKQYNHIADIPDLTLFDFVRSNNYRAVKVLIECGDDVNQCDKYGTSVLYESQFEGSDNITELLQSRGAVCMYKGKRYTTITDIPDSEVDRWDRGKIQKLKEKQNVTK